MSLEMVARGQHSRLACLSRTATGVVFAVLANFASLVTPSVSDMPHMWMRQDAVG
jgi:hypothetical protein